MNAWKPGQKAYNYNNEGQLTSLTYPSSHSYSGGSWQVVPGRMYVYGFDSMGRPNRMYTTEDRQYDLVKDVAYGPASNLTQVRYLETKGASAPEDVYYLHTNTYNTLQQLTRMTTVREGGGGGTIMDMEYRFSAAQNNGRITQQKDWVSGEEVSYQYDSLQRLISAVTTGPEWGQSFSYDGFGNLLAKSVTKGSAPALSVNVDGATNRITTAGFGYDANGNMTAIPGVSGVAYDGRNRLTAAGGDQYSYRPDNKRLWKKLPGGTEEVYFYSIRGERLGTYEPAVDGTVLYLKFKSTELYFAGSLIRSQGQAVVLDRLGSVRSFGGTAMRYFPYGEEQTSTPNGLPKFGTYFRDESTGLDYANQRYYGSGMGRFLTPDPLQGFGGVPGPGGWNQFAYVTGDPVNLYDPTGLIGRCPPGTRTGPDARTCVPVGPPGPTFRPPVPTPVHNGGGASRPGPEPPNLEVPPDLPIPVPFTLGNSLVVGPCGGTVLLTPLQLGLLERVGGWDALDRGQRAGFLNITGRMSNLGLNFLGMQLTSAHRDRLIFGPPTQGFRDSFDSLLASGVFRADTPNPLFHPGATSGGRQSVNTFSMQVSIAPTFVDVDIDYFNPQGGGLFALLHGLEVIGGMFGMRTDPFVVGQNIGSAITGYDCRSGGS